MADILVPLKKTSVRFPLSTEGASGVLVNPTVAPQVTNVQVNGADANEACVTIVQITDNTATPIVGAYTVTVDLSDGPTGLNPAANDDIMIRGTVEVENTPTNWQKRIGIIDVATNDPCVIV